MKRISAVILVLCLLLSAVPFGAVNVSAATNGTVGSCSWQLNGTELTINGNGSMGYYIEWPWGNNITRLVINEGVTDIGINAFGECKSLLSVTLPNSLKTIEKFAFYNCTALADITIPPNVTVIGIAAFSNCKKISDVAIPKSVTELGDTVFDECDSLMNISVEESNPNYSSEDGVLFNKSKTVLLKYPNNKLATSYAIPETVTEIEHHAFASAWYLQKITIPDTVTKIGVNAFFNTPLYNNDSNYDNKILYLGKHLIHARDSVDTCTIRQDTKVVADGAFVSCESLKNIIIPNGVITIGDNAFSWCSALESVTIPKSVKTIGESAFYDCINLKNIWYAGSDADKAGIFIDRYNSELSSVKWNFNACHNTSAHIWNEGTVTKQPTCTETGVRLKKCTVCGRNENESVSASGHSMGEWLQVQAPTCTAKGSEERKCTKCAYTESRETQALGHAFSDPTVIKEPTCTETGVERGSCSRCRQETTNTINALGHNFGEWSDETAATCTVGGTQKHTCTVCGNVESRNTKALGHEFENPTVVKEATISSTGLKEGKCTRCGEITSEIIPCSVTDSVTGTVLEADEGVFKEGTTVTVTEITDDEELTELAGTLAKISDTFTVYAVSAALNGAEVQPNGNVRITFVVPDNYGADIALYSIADGVATRLEAALGEDGKTLTAQISDFGNFAICELLEEKAVEDTAKENDEKTDNSVIWLIISLVTAVAVAAVILFFVKKKKA